MTELKRGGKAPTPGVRIRGTVFDAPLSFGTVPDYMLRRTPNPSYLQSWNSMTFCFSPSYVFESLEETYRQMVSLSVQVWSNLFWFDWRYSPGGIDYVPFVYKTEVLFNGQVWTSPNDIYEESIPCPTGWDVY